MGLFAGASVCEIHFYRQKRVTIIWPEGFVVRGSWFVVFGLWFSVFGTLVLWGFWDFLVLCCLRWIHAGKCKLFEKNTEKMGKRCYNGWHAMLSVCSSSACHYPARCFRAECAKILSFTVRSV